VTGLCIGGIGDLFVLVSTVHSCEIENENERDHGHGGMSCIFNFFFDVVLS